MFTHCVLFWLKDGMTDGEKVEFEEAIRALTKIPVVVHGTVGTPASTDRPVIDRTYTWGLMVAFRDLAGHDAYQVDPVHVDFRDRFAKHFAKVLVYDFEG